jgi:hypothetical protein
MHRDTKEDTGSFSDYIQGEIIILDGSGKFPKKIIVVDGMRCSKYEFKKTSKGKYLLNKN